MLPMPKRLFFHTDLISLPFLKQMIIVPSEWPFSQFDLDESLVLVLARVGVVMMPFACVGTCGCGWVVCALCERVLHMSNQCGGKRAIGKEGWKEGPYTYNFVACGVQ